MQALSFYFLVAAMALMETVSAQQSDNTNTYYGTPYTFDWPDFIIFKEEPERQSVYFTECVYVENAREVMYRYSAICQYYTDEECETPTSDPPVKHKPPSFENLKYEVKTKNNVYMKCMPDKK
ncbi:hypothetical protein [Absidia glauca]|uniref:Uncharacterized protein n=1 Tax=Absidia glauca TaxID=4829 RepID=A0A163IV74_ABSGL|nr:hypothetical protein [Absidia glauca]